MRVELIEVDGACLLARVTDEVVTVEVYAEVALYSLKLLVLRSVDIQGAGPNTVDARWLLQACRQLKEVLGVGELRIEGSARTSGANPGHVPRPITL